MRIVSRVKDCGSCYLRNLFVFSKKSVSIMDTEGSAAAGDHPVSSPSFVTTMAGAGPSAGSHPPTSAAPVPLMAILDAIKSAVDARVSSALAAHSLPHSGTG